MNIQEQITTYIASQPEQKRSDLQALHLFIQELMPQSKLWFLDGKNGENKVVSNPNIGYGIQTPSTMQMEPPENFIKSD